MFPKKVVKKSYYPPICDFLILNRNKFYNYKNIYNNFKLAANMIEEFKTLGYLMSEELEE